MIGQGLGRVAQAEKLSIRQLEDALENRTIPAYIGIPLLEEKVQLEKRMKMAQAGMQQPQMTIADQVMDQAEEITGGIDQAPINFQPSMAGGGIVAFEGGGYVPRFQNQGLVDVTAQMTEEERILYEQTGQLPMRLQTLQGRPMGQTQDLGIAPPMEEETETVSLTSTSDKGLGATRPAFKPLDIQDVLTKTDTMYEQLYGAQPRVGAPGDKMEYVDTTKAFFEKAGVNLDLAAQQAAEIAAEKEALGGKREEAKNMRIIEAGLAIMAGTSPNAFENIGKGATKAMQGFASDIKDLQKTERELTNASRQLMQAQNEINMGVASAASKDYQSAVDRYNAASDKMADRKAQLADKLMSDDRARQIVEAQTRSSTYEQMREDYLSGDPKRQEFAEKYFGVAKTGALTPAIVEKEWGDMKPIDRMRLRQQGINTVDEYVRYRLGAGAGGMASGAGNDPLGLRTP